MWFESVTKCRSQTEYNNITNLFSTRATRSTGKAVIPVIYFIYEGLQQWRPTIESGGSVGYRLRQWRAPLYHTPRAASRLAECSAATRTTDEETATSRTHAIVRRWRLESVVDGGLSFNVSQPHSDRRRRRTVDRRFSYIRPTFVFRRATSESEDDILEWIKTIDGQSTDNNYSANIIVDGLTRSVLLLLCRGRGVELAPRVLYVPPQINNVRNIVINRTCSNSRELAFVAIIILIIIKIHNILLTWKNKLTTTTA